jgi:hypothetical protein
MAKYKLLQEAFVDNHLRKAGAVVTVSDDTIPGSYMVPMDAAAKAMAKKVNLVNDTVSDYVDELTGQIDVTKFGASPQGLDSGILNQAESDGMLDANLLRA